MKNGAKKIIAVGLGICVFAVWFVFLLFVINPYTEKLIIWLPDNYRLENIVSSEVVSIMPKPDIGYQSDKVFYSQLDMDSFKKLFGKNQVVVKIQDTSYPGNEGYKIVYQMEFDCAGKSFVVVAQEYYKYNKSVLSEIKLKDRELFLKYNRNTIKILGFSIIGFVIIGRVVFLYMYTRNGLA